MRISILIVGAALSIIAGTGGVAWAQDSFDQKIDQYIKVMHLEENYSLGQQKELALLANLIFARNPSITVDQRKIVLDAINTVLPQFRDAQRAAYKDALKTVYTEEEVTKVIEFYSTPLGQSVISKSRLFALQNDLSQKSISNTLVFPALKQKITSNETTKSLILW